MYGFLIRMSSNLSVLELAQRHRQTPPGLVGPTASHLLSPATLSKSSNHDLTAFTLIFPTLSKA
jgi:hypothetical protein